MSFFNYLVHLLRDPRTAIASAIAAGPLIAYLLPGFLLRAAVLTSFCCLLWFGPRQFWAISVTL